MNKKLMIFIVGGVLSCITTMRDASATDSNWVGFPQGFRWCVSTAAHQIEGNNVNSDWWNWEKTPGHILNGDHSGLACDHWNRVEEDAQLINDLNVKNYRFSVEWAKIQPKENEWDWDALEHYRQEVITLKRHGIEPIITLYHFTLPMWVADHGGLKWDGLPQAFEKYTEIVVGALAPLGVRDWITLNEPVVIVVMNYLAGQGPPGLKLAPKDLFDPLTKMLKAHALAYAAIHKIAPNVRVGIAHHLRIFRPDSIFNPITQWLAAVLSDAFNWAFFNAVETGTFTLSVPLAATQTVQIDGLKNTQDFLGVNYYSRDTVSLDFTNSVGVALNPKKGAPVTDLNWEIYPHGFYTILKEVHKRSPNKPILVTENGIADSSDSKRAGFIEGHLLAMKQAINEGVPVEGYCHWSLMDNFEWAEGFWPRFGLYEMNYKTFERTPRASARLFSEIVGNNGFSLR